MSDRITPKDPKTGSVAASGGSDVALVHGVTDDGQGLHVIRRRRDTLETGVVRPLREGKPIQGEIVTLRPRKECPLLCDVEVELSVPAQRTDTRAGASERRATGPAQVATDRYRTNWELIFGARKLEDEVVN